MNNAKPNPFFPHLEQLKSYRGHAVRCDALAGATVAVFAIPQVMAYAMLAGVSPVYGLYAAIVMSIIAALWGSSSFVNTGPTNSAALLTAAAMLPFTGHDNIIGLVFLLTLLVGIFRFLMGVFRLGTLVEFVPESAFLGFTVGAGLLIAMGQFHHLLGLEGSNAAWFPQRMYEEVLHANELHILTVVIGLGVFGLMIGLDTFSRRFPIALLAIAGATLITFLLGDDTAIPLVQDIASISGSLPSFQAPSLGWKAASALWPAALAIAILGLIEAVSIGQTLALKHKQALDFDQEFKGQGLSHIVGAFFQGIPGSGSFSRSMLIEQSGGKTPFSNVFLAGLRLQLWFLSPGY